MAKDRVLLVDDEQPNLDLYQLLLGSEFELLTASCAAEGRASPGAANSSS